MDFVTTLVYAFIAALIVGCVTFGIALRMGRYDVVDAAWGWMFIVPVWVAVGIHNMKPSALLVAIIVTAWGMRLSYHIVGRIRSTDHEDERYGELRANWPRKYRKLQVFVRIYMLQALLATIIAIPVYGIAASPSIDGRWMALGAIVALTGIAVETIADTQLRLFIGNPANKGKLMTSGLWHYSRHPNYFGETLVWWGLGVAALGSSIGIIGLIGPVVITTLLLFISGVPLAERRAQSRPGWQEYKQKTPVLVPFIKL